LAPIGVDIGKDVLHVIRLDHSGQIILGRKIKRLALINTFETPTLFIVRMEACLSVHFVSRTLRKLGF
jgi:transposase